MSKLKYKSNYLAFSVACRNRQGTLLLKVHVTNIAIHTMHNLFFTDHTVLFFSDEAFSIDLSLLAKVPKPDACQIEVPPNRYCHCWRWPS